MKPRRGREALRALGGRVARVAIAVLGLGLLASCGWSCDGDELADGSKPPPLSPITVFFEDKSISDGRHSDGSGTIFIDPPLSDTVELRVRSNWDDLEKTSWDMELQAEIDDLRSGQELSFNVEAGEARVTSVFDRDTEAVAMSGTVTVRYDWSTRRIEGEVRVQPASLDASFEGELYGCWEADAEAVEICWRFPDLVRAAPPCADSPVVRCATP